ncbi:hypothetical protein MCERE10_02610 [Burkholderiaceae bacterium]|jgi:hypothetical protein
MEKRVLTLELVVEQNTKMVERLDRSMAQLTQAVADLRVEMGKGFSDLRQEMAHGQAELRKEMAADHEKLRNKIETVQTEMQKYVDKKFFWLLSAYLTTLIAVLSMLAKLFVDVYAK